MDIQSLPLTYQLKRDFVENQRLRYQSIPEKQFSEIKKGVAHNNSSYTQYLKDVIHNVETNFTDIQYPLFDKVLNATEFITQYNESTRGYSIELSNKKDPFIIPKSSNETLVMSTILEEISSEYPFEIGGFYGDIQIESIQEAIVPKSVEQSFNSLQIDDASYQPPNDSITRTIRTVFGSGDNAYVYSPDADTPPIVLHADNINRAIALVSEYEGSHINTDIDTISLSDSKYNEKLFNTIDTLQKLTPTDNDEYDKLKNYSHHINSIIQSHKEMSLNFEKLDFVILNDPVWDHDKKVTEFWNTIQKLSINIATLQQYQNDDRFLNRTPNTDYAIDSEATFKWFDPSIDYNKVLEIDPKQAYIDFVASIEGEYLKESSLKSYPELHLFDADGNIVFNGKIVLLASDYLSKSETLAIDDLNLDHKTKPISDGMMTLVESYSGENMLRPIIDRMDSVATKDFFVTLEGYNISLSAQDPSIPITTEAWFDIEPGDTDLSPVYHVKRRDGEIQAIIFMGGPNDYNPDSNNKSVETYINQNIQLYIDAYRDNRYPIQLKPSSIPSGEWDNLSDDYQLFRMSPVCDYNDISDTTAYISREGSILSVPDHVDVSKTIVDDRFYWEYLELDNTNLTNDDLSRLQGSVENESDLIL